VRFQSPIRFEGPVRFEVSQHCPYGQEETFRTILGVDLRVLFSGMGPLPSVVGVEEERGSWDHVGATRRPRLSDGSSALETLTEVRPPYSLAYDITEITGMLGWFAERVHSEWALIPDRRGTYAGGYSAGGTYLGGTTVLWRYEVYPRPLRTALVDLLLGRVWKAYMRRALYGALREVDRQEAGL
jgi:hypothetical protein